MKDGYRSRMRNESMSRMKDWSRIKDGSRSKMRNGSRSRMKDGYGSRMKDESRSRMKEKQDELYPVPDSEPTAPEVKPRRFCGLAVPSLRSEQIGSAQG